MNRLYIFRCGSCGSRKEADEKERKEHDVFFCAKCRLPMFNVAMI